MEKYNYVLFGDVEAAIAATLRTAPEISGFAGGAPTVSTSLDGRDAGQRWIVVSLEGGSFQWPKLEKARVDINVLISQSEIDARTTCHDLARKALAVLFREMGQPQPTYGVRVSGIQVETGLTRADDRLNDSARYLFALRISFVPHP